MVSRPFPERLPEIIERHRIDPRKAPAPESENVVDAWLCELREQLDGMVGS